MDAAAHLDVHTLGIIGLAVGATIAFSFTLLSLALRGMAALHIWAAAFWLLTLAGLAEGYDENAGFLSAIVGSALIAVANAAMLIGIALHIGRPLRWQGPAGVVVIFLAIQAGFMLWPPAQAVEAAVFGAKSIFWDAWMIGLLLFRAPRELRTSCAFTALVFVIDTFFYLARGAVSLFPETNSHAWIAQMLTTSNYLFGILCTFLLSTGFTLMLVQRLVHDLRRAAEVDGLTGLLNRTALVKESAPKMTVGRPHAALLFDLDNFKAVNDCWGHAGGDAVLKHFADIVRTGGLPERALFSRYGGEEFLLLLPEANVGGAALLAEALRLRIQNAPAHFDGGSIAFTTSVGVSTVVGPELHRLIEAADSALYRAKNAGRNRVEVA